MSMAKFFLPLSVLLSLIVNAQTCILLVALNDSVVIGADSKTGVQTFSLDRNIHIQTPFYNREDCKIDHERGVFYFASGRWAGNILKYAKESILKQTTFKDSIQYLQKETIKDLETHLENQRLYDYKNYRIEFKKHIFAELAFVWFDRGIPKACGLKFIIISDSTEKVKIRINYFHFNIHEEKSIRTIIVLALTKQFIIYI